MVNLKFLSSCLMVFSQSTLTGSLLTAFSINALLSSISDPFRVRVYVPYSGMHSSLQTRSSMSARSVIAPLGISCGSFNFCRRVTFPS